MRRAPLTNAMTSRLIRGNTWVCRAIASRRTFFPEMVIRPRIAHSETTAENSRRKTLACEAGQSYHFFQSHFVAAPHVV